MFALKFCYANCQYYAYVPARANGLEGSSIIRTSKTVIDWKFIKLLRGGRDSNIICCYF